jgi:uncharacterized protein HemX
MIRGHELRALVVALAVVMLGLMSSPVQSSAEATTTSTAVAMTDDSNAGQTKSVIPQPNSGSAPKQIGDRGGAGQIAVFGLLISALAIIGAVIVRSTMRNARIRDANLETSREKGNDPRTP